MTIYIGTSGWSYDHWQGVLYPHGLPAADRLNVYTQRYQDVFVYFNNDGGGNAALNADTLRWLLGV